jgi:hypothetical protein
LILRAPSFGTGLAHVSIMDSSRGNRGSRMIAQKGIHRSPQTPVRIRRLTLDLDELLHRSIKKNAAEEGVTMAAKLRAILAKHYSVPNYTP